MIDLDGLLGKVANNGATLLGILAHGEWNTLVQAVKELQQVVASDERLATLSDRITALNDKVTALSATVESKTKEISTLTDGLDTLISDYSDISKAITAIKDDDTLHHTIRFGGVITRVVSVVQMGLTITDYTYADVFYYKPGNRFVIRYNGLYYSTWSTVTPWADYLGTPRPEKVYLCDGRVYVYDGTELAEVGGQRFTDLETAMAEVQHDIETLQENHQATTHTIETLSEDVNTSIQALQAEDRKNHIAFFNGFVTDTIEIEQKGYIPQDGMSPFGSVLFYEKQHCFVYKDGFKYYNTWSGMDPYQNDASQPYTTKLYIYDNRIYMYDYGTGKLMPVGAGIVALKEEAYQELSDAGLLDDNMYYATLEDDESEE